MRRRLGVLFATLVVVAGLGAVVPGPAAAFRPPVEAQVTPHHGVYRGWDARGWQVSFTFGGEHDDKLTHFHLNHTSHGAAHVSPDGVWEETCQTAVCFRGHWVSDTEVEGAWRRSRDTTWHHFRARFHPPGTLHEGKYFQHASPSVNFSYRDGRIIDFSFGRQVVGDAEVTSHHFHACYGDICFRGHWQDTHDAAGAWSRNGGVGSWHPWDATAIR